MTGVPERLDVVCLGARDVPALRDFYAALGWRPLPREGMFHRFDLSGSSLMVFPLDLLSSVVGLPAPAEDTFRGTVNALVIGTPGEAEEILAAASAAGGRILHGLERRAWGSTTAYFADPELNVWEVALLPGATYDDRGALVWPGARRTPSSAADGTESS